LDPADVTVDAAGIVSVTDYDKNQVFRFDAEGTVLETLGVERQYRPGENEEPGYLSQPWGAAIDPQGNLYVAEHGGRRVQVFAPDGAPLGVIESEATESGQLVTLMFVAVSPDGLLYVADNRNGRVQIFRLLSPLAPALGTPAFD
jgi:DNA-binding beta-propeller fold protein YncE